MALRDDRTWAYDSSLAMAIRRGEVMRDRCGFCGSDDLLAIMADLGSC
jgi:hypothetical protein